MWKELLNQRGTIEEYKTMASRASRNAKQDSKEFPRIVPPSERREFAESVLFLMATNYSNAVPPPKDYLLPLFLCE